MRSAACWYCTVQWLACRILTYQDCQDAVQRLTNAFPRQAMLSLAVREITWPGMSR
jgi:hypothetical protein